LGHARARAFTQELLAGGGTLLAQAVYDSRGMILACPSARYWPPTRASRATSARGGAGTKLEFEPRSRADLDFIFVASQPVSARLLRPQLRFQYAGEVPVYSTSDAFATEGGLANQDLDA